MKVNGCPPAVNPQTQKCRGNDLFCLYSEIAVVGLPDCSIAHLWSVIGASVADAISCKKVRKRGMLRGSV